MALWGHDSTSVSRTISNSLIICHQYVHLSFGRHSCETNNNNQWAVTVFSNYQLSAKLRDTCKICQLWIIWLSFYYVFDDWGKFVSKEKKTIPLLPQILMKLIIHKGTEMFMCFTFQTKGFMLTIFILPTVCVIFIKAKQDTMFDTVSRI